MTQDSQDQNSSGQSLLKGRLNEPTDAFVMRFTASVGFDYRLAEYDIIGSVAHVRMLCRAGLLSSAERDSILGGFRQIQEEIKNDKFSWSVELEDVHMNLEHRLIELIGEAGKKLHTGRSRNDQVATTMRLYLRSETDLAITRLTDLMHVLLQLAEANTATIMPGFTHLQAAQPVTFGHHMLAWAAMLERDLERLLDCRNRLNRLPLGAAALAGTSFPIDRQFVADALGFSALCSNSLDAVSDRDFIIEFCAFSSLLMMHLSRWAEELILWSSAQFDFISLPDRFCTGSSIMPHKKNPDVPELVRGKSGRVFGHLMALLTLMKAQPLAYNKDNQEDKEPLFDTVDTTQDCIQAFTDMLPHLELNTEAMLDATKHFTTATDLVEQLVKRGMPFRSAHTIVGRVVAETLSQGKEWNELPAAELQKFSALIDDDLIASLTPEGSVAMRQHEGGTAPMAVSTAVGEAEKRLAALQSRHQKMSGRQILVEFG